MNATRNLTVMTNAFHGTEYRTTRTREELDAIADRFARGDASEAEKAFIRRVRKALCGMDDCKCGLSEYDER